MDVLLTAPAVGGLQWSVRGVQFPVRWTGPVLRVGFAMFRMLISVALLLTSGVIEAALVEFSWTVAQEQRRAVWYSAPYPPGVGYEVTFSGMPPASGSGRLFIHARGDYTTGGDEGLPELIAFDLDELYVATELDAQQQIETEFQFVCNYPGVFPSLERGPQSPDDPLFAAPPPFCLPLAGPDAGATIIAIHDGIGQDVEWEQEFFLDAAGLAALTADGMLRINASTLDSNVFPEQQAVAPFFEMRLTYVIPEPASAMLLAFGLAGLMLTRLRSGSLGRSASTLSRSADRHRVCR
jgi:hypothetical protein